MGNHINYDLKGFAFLKDFLGTILHNHYFDKDNQNEDYVFTIYLLVNGRQITEKGYQIEIGRARLHDGNGYFVNKSNISWLINKRKISSFQNYLKHYLKEYMNPKQGNRYSFRIIA